MKALSYIFVLVSLNAFANDILVDSPDCRYRVSDRGDVLEVSVEKKNSTSSLSSWDFDLPKNKISLPLKQGLRVNLKGMIDDTSVITYKNGILTDAEDNKSNFTKDTLVLEVSPDLKQIRSASFTRKGRGVITGLLLGSEGFKCKF